MFLGRYCGSDRVPDLIVSKNSRMLISFMISDSGTKFKGFTASYEGRYIIIMWHDSCCSMLFWAQLQERLIFVFRKFFCLSYNVASDFNYSASTNLCSILITSENYRPCVFSYLTVTLFFKKLHLTAMIFHFGSQQNLKTILWPK